MKLQISIQHLENAIEIAKNKMKNDSSMSDILEIELIKQSDTHLGHDQVRISQKNNYAECVSSLIGY